MHVLRLGDSGIWFVSPHGPSLPVNRQVTAAETSGTGRLVLFACRMPHKRVVLTLALALLAGIGLFLASRPLLARRTALVAIAAADPDQRAEGWAFWQSPDRGASPRAIRFLPEILDQLRGSENTDVWRDAALGLDAIDVEPWTDLAAATHPLIAALASSEDETIALIAADWLDAAPRTTEASAILELAAPLVVHARDVVRRAALDAVASYLGPDRATRLDELALRPDDTANVRRRHLLIAASDAPSTCPDPLPTGVMQRADVLDARWLRDVMARPNDTTRIRDEAALAVDVVPAPALPVILRYATDAASERWLHRRADDGDRAARFALHARSASRDVAQAERILALPSADLAERRLAAWRTKPSAEQLTRTLGPPLADPGGAIGPVVLLAERRLPTNVLAEFADAWITSFDDDAKRAGAVLTALAGLPTDELRRAAELENEVKVRTIQRLALAVRAGDMDQVRLLAYRTGHRSSDQGSPADGGSRSNGGFDPDTTLLLLAAGSVDGVNRLTGTPDGQGEVMARNVQAHSWMIERFVPDWYERAGRPVGGRMSGLRLYFEFLDARRTLVRRTLRFDPADGRFRE